MIHFQDIQFRYEGTISSEIGVKDINPYCSYRGVCSALRALWLWKNNSYKANKRINP